VHRDLKPDNIWLETGPDGMNVRILDFGLARPIGDAEIDGVPHLTKASMLAGTPAYMSPEQADGRTMDARGDLWSAARRVTPIVPDPEVLLLMRVSPARDT
jgi:serine/threonine protein kinase